MIKRTFVKYQLTIIFILMIFVPGILKIAGVKGFERKDESRRFKDEVKFDIGRLDYFPAAVDSFTNDNFYFRTPFLDFFHRMKFFAFDVSPHPDQTIIGKEGWYFIAGKELEIIKRDLDFSNEELAAFKKEWQGRIAYLEQLDIPAFLIMAPMKHHVYDDKLPYNIYQSPNNRTTILAKYLDSNFPGLIIDPLEVLKANKDKGNLYFKLDNHWNTCAGYLTAELIVEKLRLAFPEKNVVDIPPFYWKGSTIQSGIHYHVMGIDELEEYADYPVFKNPQSIEVEKFEFEGVEGFAYPQDFEKRFVNKSLENGLRVLVIRDSYAEAVLPFFCEIFKESLFIFDAWQYKLNKLIIESYKPDVVIFLGLETHVENYVKNYDSE